MILGQFYDFFKSSLKFNLIFIYNPQCALSIVNIIHLEQQITSDMLVNGSDTFPNVLFPHI